MAPKAPKDQEASIYHFRVQCRPTGGFTFPVRCRCAMAAHHGAPSLTLARLVIATAAPHISRFNLGPFVARMTASRALAAASGMPLATTVKSFETGVGETVAHTAIVVPHGTKLVKMM